MTLPVEINPLLLGSNQGYQISRSVRLRSSASAFFSRTPASAGNRTTWTWSGWVKRGRLGALQAIFCAGASASPRGLVEFEAADTMRVGFNDGTTWFLASTSAVFRDPSAWYHVVVAFDLTNGTNANRVRLWVNNTLQSFASTPTWPTTAQVFNNNVSHVIGSYYSPYVDGLDGYLTEINFIDGQALTPAAFGETNPVTGVWQPKKYAGTYGTNGFYLNFADNSAATATAIGADRSGNGNNWTPNNISLTLGATYDSMLDVPTNWADGGNGRGNYCVLNPLDVSAAMLTLSNGNLTATQPSTGTSRSAFGSMLVTTGKWYFEGSVTTTSNASTSIAIGDTANTNVTFAGYRKTGGTFGLSGNPTFNTYVAGDIIGVAFDMDASTITFYKNGVAQGVGAYSFTNGGVPASARIAIDSLDTTGAWNLNFGQRPFAYTPPTGFRALNTQNLPEPLISRGNRWMDATTYTGNGSTQSIVNSGAMQPDLVWIKARSFAHNHLLFDAVRGKSGANYNALLPNLTNAETGYPLTSLNADGFTMTNVAGNANAINESGITFVGWQWRRGAQAGFDIVTWTGSGSSLQTINHSLGVAPRMMIVRPRNSVDSWYVYHASMGNTGGMTLNGTGAFAASAGYWNNTTPTSSAFTLGSFFGSTANFIAYLFAEVAGFSRFGSYTGNGSNDGPFVFCGFRPRYVLIKCTSAAADWDIIDTARDLTNNGSTNALLFANLSNAEAAGSTRIDFVANGFKVRNTNSDNNASGATYIFAAFAENPTKYALAR